MQRMFTFLLFLLPLQLLADNFSPLVGLWDVHVEVVKPVPEDLTAAGLTPRMLQTDAELRMRVAGIQVGSGIQISGICGTLQVQLNGFRLPNGVYAYTVEVTLTDSAKLERDEKQIFIAVVWRRSMLGTNTTPVGKIREVVRDYTDEFINDYLAANPGKHWPDPHEILRTMPPPKQ